MSKQLRTPEVPAELEVLLDERTLEVHKHWQHVRRDELLKTMPEPTETQFGAAVILKPKEEQTTPTVVVALPHEQSWKPSMYARVSYMRDVVVPGSQVVILPNNTFSDSGYYSFDSEDRARIAGGNMRPLFENSARILESIGVEDEIYATGYSMGGVAVLGLAGVVSDKFSVRLVNADEAPNRRRLSKDLKRDFLRSGGWSQQHQAIEDSAVPVMEELLSAPRLALDYIRFGLGALLEANKVLHAGMAQTSFNNLLKEAGNRRSGIAIKLGYVVGSRLVDEELLLTQGYEARCNGSRVRIQSYTGDAARSHVTADNIVAHALMFKQALELLPLKTKKS